MFHVHNSPKNHWELGMGGWGNRCIKYYQTDITREIRLQGGILPWHYRSKLGSCCLCITWRQLINRGTTLMQSSLSNFTFEDESVIKFMCMRAPSSVQIIYNFSQSKILSTLISLFLKMIFQTGAKRGKTDREGETSAVQFHIFFLNRLYLFYWSSGHFIMWICCVHLLWYWKTSHM